MTSNPLRQNMKLILQTFDSLSRQNGTVEKDLLLSALYGKINVDEAEELMTYLIKEGILKVTETGLIEKP
ncbi:MAG TPA: hypothetical protein VJZ03_05345 [Candidatus Bathyarchaeia archaeon]|nr:hypothetical protein [Candidatus Bathyarchaeia archaeon]